MSVIELMFSGFWIWLGFMFLIWAIVYPFVAIINQILRHGTIRKHGYPPVHCDSDGHFRDAKNEIND